jgi:hypothetical protein
LESLKKSLRVISKAQVGQKWPAGPTLAAPGLGKEKKSFGEGWFLFLGFSFLELLKKKMLVGI